MPINFSNIKTWYIFNVNGRDAVSILMTIGLAILISATFIFSPWAAILIILSFIAVVVLINKPEIGMLTIIILVSSIVFEESLPSVSIGMGNLYVPDLILLLLILVSIFHFLRRDQKAIKFGIVEFFLIIFALAIVISAINAIEIYGVDIKEGLGRFRILSYYFLYFTVLMLIKKKTQLKFLGVGVFAIGAIVTFAMILQAVLGDSVIIMPGRVEAAYASDGFGNATRILPPGQMLVHFLFIVSGSILSFSRNVKRKTLLYFLFTIFGIGELLTYNRSFWVSVFIVFFLALIFFRETNKRGIIVKIFAPITLLTMIVASIILLIPSQEIDGYIYSIEKRFSSLFVGKDLIESDSLEYRIDENKAAIEGIKSQPVFGNGLGNKYRQVVDPQLASRETYIHNGYLWILLNAGFVGAIPLVMFFLTFVWRVRNETTKEYDSFTRSVKVGVALAVISVLLINIVNPVTMVAKSIVIIVMAMGIVRVINSVALDSPSSN